MLRAWTNVDSDDDLRRHRLDDVARSLTCQVVALSRRPSSVGLVAWRCHVVVVVGVCRVVRGVERWSRKVVFVGRGGGGPSLWMVVVVEKENVVC
jgi:hypothetical protein